jgi:hypothetical protein
MTTATSPQKLSTSLGNTNKIGRYLISRGKQKRIGSFTRSHKEQHQHVSMIHLHLEWRTSQTAIVRTSRSTIPRALIPSKLKMACVHTRTMDKVIQARFGVAMLHTAASPVVTETRQLGAQILRRSKTGRLSITTLSLLANGSRQNR